jgi:hypothetical protein
MEWRKSGKLICTIQVSSLLSLSLSQNLSFAVVAHGIFFQKHKERERVRRGKKEKRQGSSLK